MEKGRSLVTNIDRKGKWRRIQEGIKKRNGKRKGRRAFTGKIP